MNNSTIVANCCGVNIRKLALEFQKNNQAGDAIWILTSAFIIFTMQSGFGLLEAGNVSIKNESNIMIKNAIDVIFGALGYWICGFGFSFGDNNLANEFSGFGHFFTESTGHDFGSLYAKYFFQLSFATTATTIVSGAMAERTNLKAYMFFSFVNFMSYVFPAHWIWDERGFLKKLKVVDVAGCGPVHIVGGTSALVATLILKPRHGAFSNDKFQMASPTNVVLGTFMLWWGWLGFNCGSTFGVSGGKWKLASRAAVTTVNASVGGGIWSILYSYYLTKDFKGKLNIGVFTNGILGGLVSITAVCAVCRPWEALLIGAIGGAITSYGSKLIAYLKIDDPVQCIPIHGFCGIWGLLVVGFCAERDDSELIGSYYGVFKGGPASFLGYQALACISIACWSAVASCIQLLITDQIFGLRMSLEDELIGADASEHGIYHDRPLYPNKVKFESHKDEIKPSASTIHLNRVNASLKSWSPLRNRSNTAPMKGTSTKHHGTALKHHGIFNYGFLSIDNTEIKTVRTYMDAETAIKSETDLNAKTKTDKRKIEETQKENSEQNENVLNMKDCRGKFQFDDRKNSLPTSLN